MILTILSWLFYSILVYFLIIVIKDIVSYYKLGFYKKQGIKVDYIPFFGFDKNFIGESDTDDHFSFFKKTFNKSVGQDLVAFNSPDMSNVIMPISAQFNKILVTKELDYCVKEPITPHVQLGFFE